MATASRRGRTLSSVHFIIHLPGLIILTASSKLLKINENVIGASRGTDFAYRTEGGFLNHLQTKGSVIMFGGGDWVFEETINKCCLIAVILGAIIAFFLFFLPHY